MTRHSETRVPDESAGSSRHARTGWKERGTAKKALGIAFVVAIGGFLVWPYAFTVVPIDRAEAQAGRFDAVVYVDGIWDRLTTTIREDAVDLAEILAAIRPTDDGRAPKDELTAVAERFGLITAGEAHVYKVKATGKVTSIDTKTSLGTVVLAIDGYDGPIVTQVYIGPRIPSDESSIRDAVGFIGFGDFRDQTEYGKVLSEINGRISAMLATLDPDSLLGKTVTLYGAMTIRTFNLVEIDVRAVRVVPIAIELR
jgi:predicted lipoprotein